MHIRRNWMRYVSKKQPGKSCALPHKLGEGEGGVANILRGMLVCNFIKIEIYLAGEIIIIYQDFVVCVGVGSAL